MVGVVWLEGYPISVELFRELFGLKLVPFVSRRPVLLILLESSSVELIPLLDTLVRENAFVSLNTELLAAWSRSLIFDKRGEGLPRLNVGLPLHLFDHLLEVLLASRPLQSHCVLLHAKLLKVSLDVVNGFLILSEFDFFLSVVVTEVARI